MFELRFVRKLFECCQIFFLSVGFLSLIFFLHSLLTYVHASSFISTTLIRLSRLMCLSKKKQCTFWAFTAWAIWSTTKFKPGNIRWYLLCTGILYRTNWNLFAFVLRSKYNNKQTNFWTWSQNDKASGGRRKLQCMKSNLQPQLWFHIGIHVYAMLYTRVDI